jgi:hypothetical protein
MHHQHVYASSATPLQVDDEGSSAQGYIAPCLLSSARVAIQVDFNSYFIFIGCKKAYTRS